MRRFVRNLLWIVLPSAVLLTGCFSVDMSYVVNEDGSGSHTVRMAFPQELVSALGGELPSQEELRSDPEMLALQEALGDRGSVTFFSNDEEGFGFEMTVNVPASEDFGAALEQALADLPQDSELPIGEITDTIAPASIVRDGDTWTFSQEMSAVSSEDLAALSGGDDTAAMAGMFLDQSTITVRISLPGSVAEHNADQVEDDGTLVWIQEGADEPRVLSAQSSLSAGNGAMRAVLIVAGTLAAALLVAGLAYLAMRRSGGDGAPAEG